MKFYSMQPLDIAIKKGFPKVIKLLGNLYKQSLSMMLIGKIKYNLINEWQWHYPLYLIVNPFKKFLAKLSPHSL